MTMKLFKSGLKRALSKKTLKRKFTLGEGGLNPIPAPLNRVGTLLEGFESLSAGWTNGGGQVRSLSSALAVQGQYAMDFANNVASIDYNKVINGFDPATLGACLAYFHFDDDVDWQSVQNATFDIRILNTGTIRTLAGLTNVQNSRVGGHWITGIPDATTQAAAAGNHNFRIRTVMAGPKTGAFAVDAAYYAIGQQARFIMSFDDVNDNIYYEAFPIMKSLGIIGVINITPDWMGQPGKLTWDMVGEIAAYTTDDGRKWSIQADGAYASAPMTSNVGGLAGTMADLSAIVTEIMSHGYPRPDGFCYPNGDVNKNGVRINTASATADGSTTLTAVTTTAGITPGMRVIIPTGTRTNVVVSVNTGAGTVLCSESMGTFTGAAQFVDATGDWHGTKMQAAIRSSGIFASSKIFGRNTGGGSMFSQFGIAPDQSINCPGTSTTGMTFATFKAALDSAIARSSNIDFFNHFITSGSSGLKWASSGDFIQSMTYSRQKMESAAMINTTYTGIINLDGAATAP